MAWFLLAKQQILRKCCKIPISNSSVSQCVFVPQITTYTFNKTTMPKTTIVRYPIKIWHIETMNLSFFLVGRNPNLSDKESNMHMIEKCKRD